MLGQSSTASCGACAVSNGLKALGLQVDEGEVLKWMDRVRRQVDAGATGTSADLMVRSMSESRYKLKVRKLVTTDRDYAALALRGALQEGAVAILFESDDDGGHWLTAIGVCGPRYLVADGANRELVLSYDTDQLIARWTQDSGELYAMLIQRKR